MLVKKYRIYTKQINTDLDNITTKLNYKSTSINKLINITIRSDAIDISHYFPGKIDSMRRWYTIPYNCPMLYICYLSWSTKYCARILISFDTNYPFVIGWSGINGIIEILTPIHKGLNLGVQPYPIRDYDIHGKISTADFITRLVFTPVKENYWQHKLTTSWEFPPYGTGIASKINPTYVNIKELPRHFTAKGMTYPN